MERSAEIESLVEEMYDRMRAGDAEAVAAMVADEDVLFVGTDGDEWWDSSESTKTAIREQLGETGGFDITAGDITGFRAGDVGWFRDQPAMSLPDGNTITMRLTGVLCRTPTGWQFAQTHFSMPANLNETLFE